MSEPTSPLNEILGRESNRTIPDRIMDQLCDLIHQETGLSLNKKKYRMRLRRKIKRQMRQRDIDDPEQYLRQIRNQKGKELRDLIEVVVVNETLVYRYPHQMQWLSEDFFPELLESSSSTLRILSAGCSTGAEPYSAAIALAEGLRRNGVAFDDLPFEVRILGIDISGDALAQARKGLYSRRPVQNAPEEIQDRYFEKVNEREYKVHPVLREWTHFRKGNLLECPLPSDNDLVLIRNVLIYFQASQRRKILRRLYHEMSRGAPLVVGHAEDLSDYSQWFRPYEEAARGIYERWSTNRDEPTVSESSSFDQTDESRDKSASEPQVEVYCSGSDKTCVYLEGTIGSNIRAEDFKRKIRKTVEEYEPSEECHFDLQDVDYFSNRHLEAFRDTLEECLENGHRVIIVTDDDELRKDLEKIFNSPWVNIVLPEDPSKTEEMDDYIEKIDFNVLNEKNTTETSKTEVDGSSPETGRVRPGNVDEEPHVDLQILPEGLLFQLSGDWSQKNCPGDLSRLLRHWIEEHQPDHVRIVLTQVEGWDSGMNKVLERLKSVGTEHYESMDVITDDPSLATRLRRSEITVRFESSIEEVYP